MNALAAFLWLPETPQHLSRQPRGAVALRPLASALVATFLLVTAFAVTHLSLPLYAHQVLGQSPRRMGMMFAFMGVVSAVVQGGLVGRIAPRVGEARLATIGGLIQAVGLALIPEAHTAKALYGGLAALAAGQAVASPSILAVVSRRTAAADQGAALGITQTAANLGRIGGPLGAGFLYQVSGAPAPFFAGAAVAVLGAVATRFMPSPTKATQDGRPADTAPGR